VRAVGPVRVRVFRGIDRRVWVRTSLFFLNFLLINVFSCHENTRTAKCKAKMPKWRARMPNPSGGSNFSVHVLFFPMCFQITHKIISFFSVRACIFSVCF
jgi:hypothetical protein